MVEQEQEPRERSELCRQFYTDLEWLTVVQGERMLAHRIRSQLGRHMIGIHQWGASVLLLGRPRKVEVTQKGHCRRIG